MMRGWIDRFVTRLRPAARKRAAPGYALIAALILLALASLAVMVAAQRGNSDGKRERELQLLFVGDQYRNAIRSYYARVPPGGSQQYPKRLEHLLEDTRAPAMVRHLRTLYVDPLTGKFDWILEMAGDRVTGVRSPSTGKPLLRANFGSSDFDGFADASSYRDWLFSGAGNGPAAVAVAAATPAAEAGAGGPPSPVPQAPVPAQPPPATNHAIQCYNEYLAPKMQLCNGPSPPYGSAISCAKFFLNAYAQCMAAGG